MANSNFQKTKTNPYSTTARLNALMHSMSSIEKEKNVILSRTVTLLIIQYSTQQRAR